MLLVFLSFIIQSALASAMGMFDFEEKVLANTMTPRLSDDMSHPLAEPKQETTTAWQSSIPTENADPMSAIMAADYARENAHFSQSGLNVHATEAKTTVAMADKPLGLSSRKYRNHGAAMYHVEPTPRKTTTPEQDALLMERAVQEAIAKHRAVAVSLAARRKEVENIFHISKESQSSEANSKVSTEAGPSSILRTLTRLIFLLAGLCSIAGLIYHKYEVIVKMYEGKEGDYKFKLPKFKVKQDDDYGSAQLPRFSPQVSTGSHMSSVVGSFCQGLSRRGAIDTTSSYGFGI